MTEFQGVITSTKNSVVKLVRSLAEKKFRESEGMFIAEGVNLLKDLPKGVNVRFLLSTEDRLDEAKALDVGEATMYVVSDSVMKAASDTVAPYGILAAVEIPKTPFAMPSGNAILLDGISDPGNLGTIIRTAAACDFKDVYMRRCVDVFSPKVVRATLGALFRVDLHDIDDDEARRLAIECDSVALDMRGEDLFESKLKAPSLLIVGSEAHGISDDMRNCAKRFAALPMQNGVESLNAAVAAAVAMYRVTVG